MKKINTIIESTTPPQQSDVLWLKPKEDGGKELIYNGSKIGTSGNNIGASENNVIELDLTQKKITKGYGNFNVTILDNENPLDNMKNYIQEDPKEQVIIVSKELCDKVREFIRNPNKKFLSVKLDFELTIFDSSVNFMFSKYYGVFKETFNTFVEILDASGIRKVNLSLLCLDNSEGNFTDDIGNNTFACIFLGYGE